MDKKEINSAALKAIAELNLPCEVSDVFKVPDHAEWCIRFTPGFGQLCASFQHADGLRYAQETAVDVIKDYLTQRDELRARSSER